LGNKLSGKDWLQHSLGFKNPSQSLLRFRNPVLELEHLERRVVPATFLVTNTNDSGTGSLRAAITQANLDSITDTIQFAINGSTGFNTISLQSALPSIISPLVIDGTSQAGYAANTLVVGNGNNSTIRIVLEGAALTGNSAGLEFTATAIGSEVKGLSFINLPVGIKSNSSNMSISGNYFGVKPDGNSQTSKMGTGIDISGVNGGSIGGTAPGQQNLFGNLNTGVIISGGQNITIGGNRFGVGQSNTVFAGNNTGVFITSLGSNSVASGHGIIGNLFGKNSFAIGISGLNGTLGQVQSTSIEGNLIGTNAINSGINLGNGSAISIMDGVTNSRVGGPTLPNVIAFSANSTVSVSGASSVGNKVLCNSIFANNAVGIALVSGANNGIIPPVITEQIQNVSGGFTYSGFVNGTPNTTYTIEFYSSLITDSRSQGANFLGSTTVTTDSTGAIGFNGFTPTQNQTAQGAGYVVTATATNNIFGTSQFSAGPPAQIAVSSGSGQNTLIGSAFANPLAAIVTDSRGDPVPNIQVQFAAPNSNPPSNPATGTFPLNEQTIVAITNSVGIAASTTLTANNFPGNFTVLSSVVGNPGISPAGFSLTNNPPAPTIISFTPTTGSLGTSVVISGTGFVGPVQVKFNGVASTGVTVNSPNQITAIVPLSASTGPISVTTSGGTFASSSFFTVTSNAISSFSVDLANPGQQVYSGVPVTLAVTALDANNNVVNNFTGVVNISTTDTLATIPPSINFTQANNGVVQFPVVFRTVGEVSVTASNGAATGTGSGIVLQGAPANFAVAPAKPSVDFPVGVSVSRVLATVKGINPNNAADFRAIINWGDGTPPSQGILQPPQSSGGDYLVVGTHLYSSINIFPISVQVNRISSGSADLANLKAVVLTPQQSNNLQNASFNLVPPDQQLTSVQLSGIFVNYVQPQPPSSSTGLFVASFGANPQPFVPSFSPVGFWDVRLTTPPSSAFLSITLNFNTSYARGTTPVVQFADDDSTAFQDVISGFNQTVLIDYITGTITVFIDNSSFPVINSLAGTVFTVVLGASSTNSNTVTVLPSEFSSGTAISIGYGSASLVSDVIASSLTTSTTVTFQNSRQTAIGLAPSSSNSNVLFRTSKYGGTLPNEESGDDLKKLADPEIISEVIRGTLGKTPEILGELIKKYLPTNPMEMLKSIPMSNQSQIIDPAIRNVGFEEDQDILPFPADFEQFAELSDEILEASFINPTERGDFSNLDLLYQQEETAGDNWGLFLMGAVTATMLKDPVKEERRKPFRLKTCA
jgi:hypothetical protein